MKSAFRPMDRPAQSTQSTASSRDSASAPARRSALASALAQTPYLTAQRSTLRAIFGAASMDGPMQLRADAAMPNKASAGLTNNSASFAGVVQRLGPDLANSSAGLVAQYNALLASAEFQKLNTTVTTNTNIILVDSSLIAGRPVDYTAATHTIRVPLNTAAVPPAVPGPRPVADVRDDILWEMHNASIRGALGRSADKFNVAAPGPGSSRDEKEKYPYQAAAYALCIEWEEWVNVVEHDLKTQKINADPAMGPGGPHVTRTFAASFAVADAGWFLFSNYLQTQIASGHTGGYDANAANADWKGKSMLSIAQHDSRANLQITQVQVNNYLSGKTTKVKQVSNNPFKNEAIIKAARNHRG